MGNLIHRLLSRHNIGKLALGQVLVVLAFMLLDPPVVHHAAYYDPAFYEWDPSVVWGNSYDGYSLIVGDNPPFATVYYVNRTSTECDINVTSIVWDVNVSVIDDPDHEDPDIPAIVVRVAPARMTNASVFPWVRPDTTDRYIDPWREIGSVDLDPGKYEIWVYEPSSDDGMVDYQVFNEGNTRERVTPVEKDATRKFGRFEYHLNSEFRIDDEGRYDLKAQVDSFKESRYMLVVPERPMAFYLVLWLGIGLIAMVVVTKSKDFLMWAIRTDAVHSSRIEGLYEFPPDVAYFFAMGPEPNWKGGAFFLFPRGTREFFEWRPIQLEFPEGTAEFFDLREGPP